MLFPKLDEVEDNTALVIDIGEPQPHVNTGKAVDKDENDGVLEVLRQVALHQQKPSCPIIPPAPLAKSASRGTQSHP